MSIGTKLIDTFPLSGTRKILVPAVPKGSEDPAFVSYHVGSTAVEVPVRTISANLGFEPIVALSVTPSPTFKTTNAGVVSNNDTLRNIAFYLTRVDAIGAFTTVPDIAYQIRATAGNCTPEVIGTGTMKLTSFAQIGLIAQVSNYLCNQFEFWAAIDGGSQTVSLQLDLIADRFVGCPRDVYKGSCGS